ncbi:MAG: hypothetical protein HY525_13360 [Betaproteobacteria bacterium]|nr:hypothetical protein [Betaproteobacteria bacterium]
MCHDRNLTIIAGRSVFLVDAQGVIRHSHACPPGTIPESKDLLERLKGI